MKLSKSILASILIIFATFNFKLSAQIAGEIPTGGTLKLPNIDLRLYEKNHDTIAYLDIDADDEMDLKIRLYKGYPPNDAPNMVFLETPGNKLSFCVDAVSSFNAVHYNLNDTLCTGKNSWGPDSIFVAGCYGGWSCTHDTSSVYNKFIAYKNNITGDVGWFKFTMKLYSEAAQTFVSFVISEMLVYELGTGLGKATNDFHFILSPNPSTSSFFSISSSKTLAMIEIYDLTGKRIASHKTDFDNIYLPERSGVYIIKVYDQEGNSSTEKLLKL